MSFKGKSIQSHEKLFGCYYTPSQITSFLVKWAVRSPTETILEPSCGDGQFFHALAEHLLSFPNFNKIEIQGVEIDKIEAEKALDVLRESSFEKYHVEIADFFKLYTKIKEKRFSTVIGNPPFIRFQNMTEKNRNLVFEIIKELGYRPSKLSNAWCAFLQLAIELVETGGRLAMVIPAELLQVNYAKELRQRLTTSFKNIILINFKKNAFAGILQEVVLLLAEGRLHANNSSSCDIQTIEIEDTNDLSSIEKMTNYISHAPLRHEKPGMKWTSLFVDNEAFELIHSFNDKFKLKKLGHYASVDVGIVTGRNSFFMLDMASKKEMNGIPKDFFVNIIGKTAALKSFIFDKNDYKEYSKSFPCYLLNTNGKEFSSFPRELKLYIKRGESAEINKGYKCRIRQRWFDVPSISVPDAFIFRQIHLFPLLVTNDAKVTATDTIHRVNFIKHVDIKKFSSLFFNSLSLLWGEICGRSYGGGVLEFQPSEAEELPVIYHDDIQIDIDVVDNLLRSGNWEKALDYVDECSLIGYYGLSYSQLKTIRNAWSHFKNRRIYRNSTSPK